MGEEVGTIKAPMKVGKIPAHAQWLLGQGVGTWFCLEKTSESHLFQIRRFTPDGNLDCDRTFEIEEKGLVFDVDQSYQFVHISHCAKCRIIQNGYTFIFNYL